MKNKVLLGILSALVLSSCGQLTNEFKHLHSALTGLHRTITLYSATGVPVRAWTTTAQVEHEGSSISWVQEGKAISINGTFVIEEQ